MTTKKEILKYAFIQTLPVLFGYVFMGIAFGILLEEAGYNFVWALFISLTVYSGSMQFVLIGLLGGGMGIISMIILTLSVQCRHIFYGLSFIEKFKAMGKRGWYMVFSLTDETYSLLCGMKIPEELNKKKVFFAVAVLDQSYWVLGCTIGGILGSFIGFDTTGIDFAMTALFVVIFIEQWYSFPSHIPAIIGICCGTAALIIFGANAFILPALIASVCLLLLLKNTIVKQDDCQEACE
ncbi:branched-chain amino acid ABC transporter permease [Acetobacterium paludosum]|uniref:Branched-chain amino acid ABC transporter permease n=1 Tax=Acetobacterium paludosum TaxID=52693 RepID=A0A923HY45_9FIRM|nr:AzlC family ABC transporter permease [Acetobacterium paludosum]MBC3889300.1 branched-chain amino acid ABC transporter permease [Acetobacterium paludosum]